MREHKYILSEDGRTPIPEPDVIKWARWLEEADRRVGFEKIGPVTISTVFLGIDHAWVHSTKPILWETMIFGASGEFEDYQVRYSSYEDALRGHVRAVNLVIGQQPKQ